MNRENIFHKQMIKAQQDFTIVATAIFTTIDPLNMPQFCRVMRVYNVVQLLTSSHTKKS